MAYVFLSHSHADKPFARKLAADLRANGHSVWIDEAEINIGDSLIEKIREGIDDVDFICAILSQASINSAWVQRELDIASNREIDERRVLVLPILVEDVELPGFLKGKLYGDFRDVSQFDASFQKLLRALGGGHRLAPASPEETAALKSALERAQAQLQAHQRATNRAERAAFRGKSETLRARIAEANTKFPQHSQINNTYAFELGGMPVTLDYVLWAISKASRKGAHPLEALLTAYNQWADINIMLEAYKEVIEAAAE